MAQIQLETHTANSSLLFLPISPICHSQTVVPGTWGIRMGTRTYGGEKCSPLPTGNAGIGASLQIRLPARGLRHSKVTVLAAVKKWKWGVLDFFFLFWKQLKDIPFVRGNSEFRSEVSLECLGSSCDDQSYPPFKGSSLLKGATDCSEKVSAPLCFSGSECCMAHLVGLGVRRRLVKWSGIWFYAFIAKAINFPLFFNVNWLEA